MGVNDLSKVEKKYLTKKTVKAVVEFMTALVLLKLGNDTRKRAIGHLKDICRGVRHVSA